ncbi:MAG: hypothetical protein ACUVTP_02985 [Candidatus Fervidibacter sp.]|uniref:hypothetical protein n=1 Tax=Candidatus Fervidibacter sp. TaxID=3100871 RepID=UPI00404ADF52
MRRREFLSAVSGAFISVHSKTTSGYGKKPKRVPRARLGMNLSGIADWNTELPFFDVFRASRPWISQRKGAGWGQGPKLELDEHGWVKLLEPDCWAETLMCTIDGGHYPSGEYTVVYEGEGEIDFWNAAKVVKRELGKVVINVGSSKGAIFLRLLKTNPQNYIRNIQVIMPGFKVPDREKPCWHPAFLNRWRGVSCFRFMDWMETNGSKIARWSDRPKVEDATFSEKGVALEWMIDLCNRIKADAWFCMPHMADDDYIYRFAKTVKEKLDPSLKVYVEYSNEVWNGIFPQHSYAAEQGKKLGFGEKTWEAAWGYTAYRSVQIFRIWEEVFGGVGRLIRVLPSQAANPYVSERILSFKEAYKHADALAIAPYVTFNVSPQGEPSADEVAQWSVDKLLDYIESVSLSQSIRWMKQQKEVADKYGLLLVAYEGGQHLIGVHGAENNEKLTKLFMEANAHQRMGQIYRQYLQAWVDIGGDLFCHFSSVSRWSKWGCWGLLQFYDEPPTPKFKAVMEWAKKLGQKVRI